MSQEIKFKTGQVVYHPELGTGKVLNIEDDRTAVGFIKGGVKVFTSGSDEYDALSDTPYETVEEEEKAGLEDIKEALREVLREEGVIGETPMAGRWEGGELILKPGTPGLKEKSVPIEVFFRKVVMVRDRLRVLEQHINASPKLSVAEKTDLQQYITRCYGSLTTFNVLFSDKDDWFVGSKED